MTSQKSNDTPHACNLCDCREKQHIEGKRYVSSEETKTKKERMVAAITL
jgi:hypothetical protein